MKKMISRKDAKGKTANFFNSALAILATLRETFFIFRRVRGEMIVGMGRCRGH
jgi:hypothetical protein